MAVTKAMASLQASDQADASFAAMVRNYRASYPDEDTASLAVDLDTARYEVELVAGDIFNTLFDANDPRRDEIYFSILKELFSLTSKEARKKMPLIKRVFGGTRFHYEKVPIPNRITKCKENVSLAGMMILAKQVRALGAS